jgi:two-component system, NarL family, response regulator DevR
MQTGTQAFSPNGTRSEPRHSLRRRLNLLVVDDHPAVLRGLQQLLDDQLDFRVTAVCSTAESAVAHAERERIDVAVVDYHLRGRDGLWVSRKLLPHPTRVVIYSAYASDHLAARCVVAGVDALLNKGGLGSELCDAIRAVAAGRRLLPRVPQPLAEMLRRRLDEVEQPIFGMLLAGISRAEIGSTLGLTRDQLAFREAAMLRKLQALPGEVPDPLRGQRRIDVDRLIPQRPEPKAVPSGEMTPHV